jgi:hypothetical protein
MAVMPKMNKQTSQTQWLTPTILFTWEVENRRIVV